VLDRPDAVASLGEFSDQFYHKGGFSGIGFSGYGDNGRFHRRGFFVNKGYFCLK
jgi:hypothetical protein